MLKLKNSSLQDTKALKQSSTIIYFRVSSRRLDSVQGTPRGHHLEPPDLKLQSCGALESKSDLDFPLYNFQWAPSIFFSVSRNCRILSSVSSHPILLGKVSHVHKHRKSSARQREKNNYINKTINYINKTNTPSAWNISMLIR